MDVLRSFPPKENIMKSPSACRVSHAMICNKQVQEIAEIWLWLEVSRVNQHDTCPRQSCVFVSCHDHIPAKYRLADAVISIQLGYYNFRFYVAKCCLLRRPLPFKTDSRSLRHAIQHLQLWCSSHNSGEATLSFDVCQQSSTESSEVYLATFWSKHVCNINESSKQY